jgi:hypothetical protein
MDMPADYLSRVSTRFFGDKGMALGLATDQMGVVLAIDGKAVKDKPARCIHPLNRRHKKAQTLYKASKHLDYQYQKYQQHTQKMTHSLWNILG